MSLPSHRYRVTLGHLLLVVFGFLIAQTGCTSIHTMPLDDVTPFYDEITNKAGNGRATIRLQNGDERLGANVRVSADSVRWVIPDMWSRQFTRPRAVHISQVKEIVIRNKVKGGVIGGVLGALGHLLAFGPESAEDSEEPHA